jgi:hypothetical protein
MAKRRGSSARQARIRLPVVSSGERITSAVALPRGEKSGPLKGNTRFRIVMECGGCGTALAQGVPASQFRGMLLQCVSCGAYVKTLGAA